MFAKLLTAVIDFDDTVYRNIHTVIPSEDLLDDLSGDPGERAYGEALVSRQREESDYDSLIDRPFRYGVAITPGGICPGINSRFSDGTAFGVWYGSLSIVTTIYETVYHWLRFLDDAGIRDGSAGPVIADRRVFRVRTAGILIDLRGKELEFPDLVSIRGYSFTHRLGDHLYRSGQKGLIVRSARDTKGTNVAAFSRDILFDPRHQRYMSYMSDRGNVKISLDADEPRAWVAMNDIRGLFDATTRGNA